jgi:hypothetical protein
MVPLGCLQCGRFVARWQGMNLAHIEAILKYSELQYTFTLPDGTRLWTNGHFALKGDFAATEAIQYPKLGELWQKAQAIKPAATTIGKICFYNDRYGQHLRLNCIDAAYFRCFDGPDVTWTETSKEQMVYAHRGSELIGVVMPMMRHDGEYYKAVSPVADADVFETFACEANDYYLADSKALRRKIEKLLADLSAAEDEAGEARLESHLAGARRRLEEAKRAKHESCHLCAGINIRSEPGSATHTAPGLRSDPQFHNP